MSPEVSPRANNSISVSIKLFETNLSEVDAAAKFLKPLTLIPVRRLTQTAAATSASFFKSRNRYLVLRFFAIATFCYEAPLKLYQTQNQSEVGDEGKRHLILLLFGALRLFEYWSFRAHPCLRCALRSMAAI